MPVSRKTNRELEAGRARREAERRLSDEDDLLLPDRPTSNRPPTLPDDLAELDDDELMKLMARLTRWSEWLNVRLTQVEITEDGAKEQLEQVRNIAILSAEYDSVTEAKAAAAQDPEVIEWQSRYNVEHAQRKLLKGMYDANVERTFVVSRELSRRIGREPYERRDRRWGGA